MCGRYTLRHNTDDIAARFEAVQISLDDALRRPRFNIAPTQAVPTITLAAPEAGAPRVLGAARWGLVPSWAKDPGIGSKMLNARAETLAEKPAFRVALQRRRCLIPADGFYEWQATTHKPHFIQLRRPLREGELFAFAGLWSRAMIELYYWPTPNGHKITLFLEEAGLEYRIVPVDIGKGAQFDADYLRISPNNKPNASSRRWRTAWATCRNASRSRDWVATSASSATWLPERVQSRTLRLPVTPGVA